MELQHSSSERPGWLCALRAGALLMVAGIPLMIAHVVVQAVSAHGRFDLVAMLAPVAPDGNIDRLYLLGVACAGSGICVVIGAALEGLFSRLFPT
jgi:hypothetical protein